MLRGDLLQGLTKCCPYIHHHIYPACMPSYEDFSTTFSIPSYRPYACAQRTRERKSKRPQTQMTLAEGEGSVEPTHTSGSELRSGYLGSKFSISLLRVNMNKCLSRLRKLPWWWKDKPFTYPTPSPPARHKVRPPGSVAAHCKATRR